MTDSEQKTKCPTVTGWALTESERMFEEYLTSQGIASWTHSEKAPPGKRMNPDYFVPFGNSELVFEVKEFNIS
jgi:hypothetical protein